MKKASIGIGVIAALVMALSCATSASAWNTSWQGAKISGVKINGGGSQATVAPGSTVNVSLHYAIKDAGCAECVDQIEVGWNDQGPDQCIYNDTPGATGASGAAAYALTAPSKPGVYYLAYDQSGDIPCNGYLPVPGPNWWSGNPPNPNEQIIGRVNVGSAVAKYQQGAVKISKVHVNGKGNNVTVAAGSTVNVALNYAISDKTCLACIDQIEVGLNNAAGPSQCVYDDIPGTGTSGSTSFSLTAPATKGSYFIAFDTASDFGCLNSTSNWWNGTPQANPTNGAPGETQFLAHLTVT
jgi:hypothetical protein